MGIRPSLGVNKLVNRTNASGGSCGGDKKAGIAPSIGANNALWRHIRSDSVSVAMTSAGVTCAQTCNGPLGFKNNTMKFWIPNCTLRPYGSGGVGRIYQVGKFIW